MPKIAITFKDTGRAKAFMKHFGTLGLTTAKASAKGSSIMVTVSDSDEAKVVRSLVKDMNEQFKRQTLSSALSESIRGCISENKARNMRLIDGSIVRLTPARAQAFAQTHDNMSEQTQIKMRRLVVESAKAFTEIMDFCKQRSNTDGDK
jgi:hypothetical protein